jgi:hypothetical protein
MPGTSVFEVYRYQLLASTDKVQISLKLGDKDFEIDNVDDLRSRKNELIARVLARRSFNLHSKHAEVKIRLEHQDEHLFVFRLGVRRSAHIYSEDFSKKDIPNWPNVLIVFHNDPSIQKIAIQRDYAAFQSTRAVASMLTDSLKEALRRFQLEIYISSLTEKQKFWDVIGKYQGKIVQLRFDLISPNLANISKSIQPSLRAILEQQREMMGSHRVGFEFNSAENSTLRILKGNRMVSSAAEYVAEGGGEGELRVRGIKKKIRTNETLREISIEEVVLSGKSEQLMAEFRRLLS